MSTSAFTELRFYGLQPFTSLDEMYLRIRGARVAARAKASQILTKAHAELCAAVLDARFYLDDTALVQQLVSYGAGMVADGNPFGQPVWKLMLPATIAQNVNLGVFLNDNNETFWAGAGRAEMFEVLQENWSDVIRDSPGELPAHEESNLVRLVGKTVQALICTAQHCAPMNVDEVEKVLPTINERAARAAEHVVITKFVRTLDAKTLPAAAQAHVDAYLKSLEGIAALANENQRMMQILPMFYSHTDLTRGMGQVVKRPTLVKVLH